MDVGEFNERRLSTEITLDYRLRLWAVTSASHAISAVAFCSKCTDLKRNVTGPLYGAKVKPTKTQGQK